MEQLSETEFIEKLNELKSLLFLFDENSNAEKINLLNALSDFNSYKPDTFKKFHQLLMSMLAYPSNKVLLDLTNDTIIKLISTLAKNKKSQEKLNGTGLLNTAIECNFSYAKVSYLVQKFPNQISIHSASSNIETQKAVFKLLLPNIEYSKIYEGEKEIKTRIQDFNNSKNSTDLEWLLQTIKQSSLDNKTQAFVYNQLGIFISWNVLSAVDSVSFLRGPYLPIYYHNKPLEKKILLPEIIKQKLPAPVSLSVKEKENIIDAAKLTLCYLYRETEPFTNANIDDITLFKLNNGISIALFGSKIDKRYSLESYIGYLVFKNNIPASYGGTWVFGERGQFGINILEAFRGGESGLIICELLRVYHQYYNVTKFVVKPYQFGLHNMEAIKTGAFWFYYKLGFRPEDNKLSVLAIQEDNEKKKNPSHKSDIATLKKFTKSNLELSLSETSYPNFDAEMLSQKITNFINTKFNGDREKAISVCFKQLTASINIDIKNWKLEDVDYAKQVAILFSIMPYSQQWQSKNKKNISLFIKLKSAKTEFPWSKHLQNFDVFWKMVKE